MLPRMIREVVNFPQIGFGPQRVDGGVRRLRATHETQKLTWPIFVSI